MQQIQDGDKVKIRYKAKTDEQTLFDSSSQKAPLEITIGDEEILPTLEQALVGMQVGEKKRVPLPADQAFGPYVPELLYSIEKEQLPKEVKLEIGQQIKMQLNGETPSLVTVKEILPESVVFDGNHPLAGKDLVFDLEVVEIKN